MTTRMYRGFKLSNVGISWYVYGVMGDNAGRWVGKSLAEARRWINTYIGTVR